MAAAGKSKEADAARCRRHPSHRHAAGVCPFCLSDRLSRLSAAASAADAASEPSSASSSGAASVASSAQTAPPCREARRARLGMLMRQEEPEAAAAGGRHGKEEETAAEGKKPAKRSNFWTRLQQASWYRRDGCSVAHSRSAGKKSSATAPHKRAASLF